MPIRRILITACLFAGTLLACAQGQLIDKVVAVVGEEVILYSDIQNQKLQAMADGYEVTAETEAIMLEEMLFQKLLLHQADLDSIMIPPEQVEAELDNRISYFCQLLGSCDALEDYYGMPIELIKDEFREMVEDNMKAESMEYSITSGIGVTPGEIEEFFNEIPTDSLPYINAQIEVGHIVLYPEITQEIKDAIYEQLVQVREELISGKKSWFGAAFDLSCDSYSSSNAGKLGWQNTATYVPEFASVCLTLDSGEVSEPFWTDYGCHIVKLLDRRGNDVNVQHILICPEVGALEREDVRVEAERIRGEIEAGTISFKDAAALYSHDEQTKNNGGKIVDPQTGMTKLDMGTVDGVLGQVVDRLEPGEISPAVSFVGPDGKKGYRIVLLQSRTAPHVMNLQDDYQMIKNYSIGQKKSIAMEEWLEKKINTSYIRIDSDYTKFEFQYDWLKTGAE